jgi:glycerophosphoryl diester phosphodiesterase
MTDESIASRLLAHRQLGFDRFDNTVAGLSAALAMGVSHVEFDVRMTRDKVLVAHHDPYFTSDAGAFEFLQDWDFRELRAQRGMAHLATVEEMMQAFARTNTAKLYIDLKIAGQEERVATLPTA